MAVIKSGATSDQLTIDATSKAARTTLYDTAGASIVANGGLYVNTNQTIYTASTGNSTTAQLASLATFTGTVDSVLSDTHVQMQIVCDQKYTVTIFQYSDSGGTKLVKTLVYRRQANEPFAETIALISDYYKTSIKNEGASATTTLSSATTLGNFPVTPAGLTNTGNLPVEVPAKATYRASTAVPLAAATTVDVPIFNIIGSATKTVTVKRISVSGMSLTAVGYFTIAVQKLSAASTGGTSATLTNVPLDSITSAATAVVKTYTAAPTRGALLGTIRSWRSLWQATTAVAGGPTSDYVFSFADIGGSGGIVLRGVAEELCLVFPVVLGSAGALSIDVEWTEE